MTDSIVHPLKKIVLLLVAYFLASLLLDQYFNRKDWNVYLSKEANLMNFADYANRLKKQGR